MQEENIKDLVIKSLDSQGTLAQIRAQIKASVFNAIDNENKSNESVFYWENKKIQKVSTQTEGQLALEVIHDFLDFFSLDYTNNVFTSEANITQKVKRATIADKCGIVYSSQKPVLLQMVEAFLKQDFSGIGTPNVNYGEEKKAEPAKPTKLKYTEKKNDPVNPVKNNYSSSYSSSQYNKQLGSTASTFNKYNNQTQDYSKHKDKANKQDDTQSDKYGDEQFEHIEEDVQFDEIELDDDDEEDDKKEQNKYGTKNASKISDSHGLYTSQEDVGLQSQGFDKSVDSLELEDYDYVENANDR